jgi:hypothetical protein
MEKVCFKKEIYGIEFKHFIYKTFMVLHHYLNKEGCIRAAENRDYSFFSQLVLLRVPFSIENFP